MHCKHQLTVWALKYVLPKMTLWIKNRFVRQMLNLTQHLSVVSVIFQPDWMDLEAVATKVVRPIRRRRTHLLS